MEKQIHLEPGVVPNAWAKRQRCRATPPDGDLRSSPGPKIQVEIEPFCYNGKVITFSAVTGIVVGSIKTAVPVTTSDGGGGTLKDGSGYISAPSIRTSVVRTHEFSVISDDGKETPVKAGGADIPLRDRQRVTAISGFPQGQDSGWWVFLYNYNFERYWYILTMDDFIDRFKLSGGWKPHLFFSLLAMPWLSMVVGGFAFRFLTSPPRGEPWFFVFACAILGPIIYGIVSYKMVKSKRDQVSGLIRSHFDGFARKLLS